MGEKEPHPGQGRKRAINRLRTLYPLRNQVQQDYLDALQAAKEGKPIVWAMLNLWQGDIPLKAMGLNVVYPENYATLLASTGSAERYLDEAEADGFPSHLCGYARSTLGYSARMMKQLGGSIPADAPLGGLPRPWLLVGSGIICDARFKWFQAEARYFDAPMWCLEMPAAGGVEARQSDTETVQVRFLVEKLREFVSFLEERVQRKMDWDRLDELIDLTVQIHEVAWQINELRKATPCPMHSTEFWASMPPALFLAGDMKATLNYYRDMLREVRERVDAKVAGISCAEKYRLILAELPPWHSLGFFDALAERGWNFVCESIAYHIPRPPDFSRITDPLEKLARLSRNYVYDHYQTASQPAPDAYVVAAYLKMGREFQADGFFLHPVHSCRAATSSLRAIQHKLLETCDIPSLWVEGDIIDRRIFDPREALARADAFEETMLHYRRRRAEGGRRGAVDGPPRG